MLLPRDSAPVGVLWFFGGSTWMCGAAHSSMRSPAVRGAATLPGPYEDMRFGISAPLRGRRATKMFRADEWTATW